MLVGIFSDVHDNLGNLNKALTEFMNRNIKTLIFCGDFCSPIPARAIGKFEGTIHCVFGNGDGDRFMISKIAQQEHPNMVLYGEYAEIEIENRKIAVTHYPFYGSALASTQNYDAVFVGHTHEVAEEIVGKCLLANPGEIMGAFGTPTCGIYNTVSNQVQMIEII